jgi:two-component system CheB/CheR fusion protein
MLEPSAIAARINAIEDNDPASALASELIELIKQPEVYEEILAIVRDPTRIDLTQYRATNVNRRLALRLVALELPDLNTYLEPHGEELVFRQEVRDRIVFAQHNLIADPPFSRLDLISCRNLFIYFSPELQTRLLEMFHYALRPTGLLFLGRSENIGEPNPLYTTIDRVVKLFRKQPNEMPRRRSIAGIPLQAARMLDAARPTRRREVASPRARAAEIMINAFAPPALLLDERCQVVFMGKHAQPCLAFPAGAMGLEVFDFLPDAPRGASAAMARPSRVPAAGARS